jgi:hypothetical protein
MPKFDDSGFLHISNADDQGSGVLNVQLLAKPEVGAAVQASYLLSRNQLPESVLRSKQFDFVRLVSGQGESVRNFYDNDHDSHDVDRPQTGKD